MKVLTSIITITCFLIIGCNKETLSPAEYVSWIENEDHGLRSSKIMGDYKLTLQYKPIDYIVLREERSDKLSNTTLRERTKQLDQMQYYNLRLQAAQPGLSVSDLVRIDNDHAAMINYFTFGMQENIQLIDGNDTLSCKLFQYERTYELAPYIDFVLAFDLPANGNKLSDKTFILNDTQLGIGPVRIQVEQQALSAIPQLITY